MVLYGFLQEYDPGNQIKRDMELISLQYLLH
jgi:hypothetical protein